MSKLIVVGFKKDMFRASQVLNELINLDNKWTFDLTDAVAVYRDYSGKLRVDSSYQPTTGEGAALGGLFGSLIGLTLAALTAAPVTAGTSIPAAGAAAAIALGGSALGAAGGAIDAKMWREEYGVSEDFVKQVGILVQPGDSAIFALISHADPEFVAGQFNNYGGMVLSTTLSPEAEQKLQKLLSGKK